MCARVWPPLRGLPGDRKSAPGTQAGEHVNLTLFNYEGAALPSIGIFRNPAAVCESYDPGEVPCVIGG